jgi:hypothetical protein
VPGHRNDDSAKLAISSRALSRSRLARALHMGPVMSRSRAHVVARRFSTYLLAGAVALTLVACVAGATGPGGGAAAGELDVASPAVDHDKLPSTSPSTALDPSSHGKILSVDVKCFSKTAWLEVETAAPADELEVRRVAEAKIGEDGRWYHARESYLLEPLHPAPGATAFPAMAQVPLDGSCEDFKAQLDEVRARFGATYESRGLR